MKWQRTALAVSMLCAAASARSLVAAEAESFESREKQLEALEDGAGVKVPVVEDYLLNCSACHGLDGAGTPGVTPTLHGVGSLLKLPGGRDYLARVPGVAQAPLSDARLARLLNWVLERYSGTPPVPLYTAVEIARLRASPLRDTRSARRNLAIPAAD